MLLNVFKAFSIIQTFVLTYIAFCRAIFFFFWIVKPVNDLLNKLCSSPHASKTLSLEEYSSVGYGNCFSLYLKL